jgi:hypothetical protein
MANSDKNIVITPRIGGTTEPTIVFTGQGNDPITMLINDGITGTGITSGAGLIIQGSQGQLFSIVNRLGTGSIFSVNDISGIPSIDVDAAGKIILAGTTGNVGIGIDPPTERLHVSGNILTTGNVAVNGGTLSTTSTTANLFNTTATTLNIGGAATTTNIASAASGLTLNIADTTIFSGTKQVNIASQLSGGATQVVTIGSNSGRMILRSSSGITFGSQATGINVDFLGNGIFGAGGLIGIFSGISANNDINADGSVLGRSGVEIGSAAIDTKTSSYTLTATDNGKILIMNSSSGTTFTVPTGLSLGYSTTFISIGSGKVGITGASGVTLNYFGGPGIPILSGQHASASIISYATNIFNVSGSLQ